MKKFGRKLLIAVLAVAMLCSYGSVALADDPTTGSIIVHKYSPLNLQGDPGDGETPPGSEYIPLQGVEYTVYKVADWGDDGIGSGYKNVAGNVDITVTAANTLSAVITNLTVAITADSITPVQAPASTDGTGQVSFANLDLGLYLVVESDASGATYGSGAHQGSPANITKLGDPFLVSIPLANAAGDGWLYNVHVYPKNATTSNTKEADETVAGIGDPIKYTITVGIPQNLEELERFIVTDHLPAGLDFTSAALYSDKDGATPLADAIFTKVDPSTENNQTLTVTFVDKANSKDAAQALIDLVNQDIYIIVNTTINKDALSLDSVKNTVEIDYGDNNPKVEVDVTTPVGKITITKVDKADPDNTKLPDVQFKIYQMVDDTENPGNQIKAYLKDPDDDGKDYIATTDTSGLASFEGLNNGTYFLEEIKSQEGYQLLKDPIQVEVKDDNTAPNTKITISNIKKFTLPITGGMGTTLFTIIGALCIVIGILAIMYARRTRKATDHGNHK